MGNNKSLNIYHLRGINYFVSIQDLIFLFILIKHTEFPALVLGIANYLFDIPERKK